MSHYNRIYGCMQGNLNVSQLVHTTYPLCASPPAIGIPYTIHSFYSLHTTSLKYMKHCAALAGKSKRLLYPKGDVPTRMSYGNEYECSFLSVQIVVSFTQTQLSK